MYKCGLERLNKWFAKRNGPWKSKEYGQNGHITSYAIHVIHML